MSNAENRDRKRSLLAYAHEDAGTDKDAKAGPLLSMAQTDDRAREDALARHQAARARRETQAIPPADARQAPETILDPARQSLLGSVSGWTATKVGDMREKLSGWRRAPRNEPPSHGATAPQEPVESVIEDDFVDEPEDNAQWKPLIDPLKVVGGIGRSKALIAACTILGAALGVGMALSTPKKYEAATELLIDPRDLKLVDRDLTQGGFSNEATLAIVENQVRVITSGTVLNKVVEALRLDEDPEFNGTGKAGGMLPNLRSLLSRGGSDADDPGRRRALAIDHLAETLSVERGGKTFVVSIRAETHDPEKSALIANTMADVFLQTYGELQSDTAGRATEELTARLDELRKSVETAERKVETFKADHDIIYPQGRLITDDELVKLNEQLSVARARRLELAAKADSVKGTNVGSVVDGVPPEALSSSTMTELRSQYAALKSEEDRLAVQLGPRHPKRQAIEAQLSGARAQIEGELRRIIASVQTELKRSIQLEQELSSRLAQLKVRQGDVSRDMVALRELEREAAARRAVYEAFLLRSRETGEQRDINTANMSVISRAYPPLHAQPPSRSTITLAGTLLGLLAGIGIGGLRGAYDSLRDTADERRRPRRARRTPARVTPSDTVPVPATDRAAGDPDNQQTAESPQRPLATPEADAAAATAQAASDTDRLANAETSIEEIRASLRDFRHAVEELAQSRTRRRYF